MGPLVALGTLIGAGIAKAGAAAAATAVAHPFLFGGAALSALGAGATAIASGASARRSQSMQAASLLSQTNFATREASSRAALQAQQMSLQLEAERLQAATEQANIQRRLRTVLATQTNLFGSSNISLSSGTPSVIAGASEDAAARESAQTALYSQTRQSLISANLNDTLSASRAGILNTQATSGLNASMLQAQGNSAFNQGLISAGNSLLGFGLNIARIGGVPQIGGAIKSDPFNVGRLSGGAAYTGGIA
jgi:hypothetical protein